MLLTLSLSKLVQRDDLPNKSFRPIGFLIACLLFFTTACDKELKVELPGKDQMVIFGTLSKSKGAELIVSRTLPRNGDFVHVEDLYVNDAILVLRDGSNEWTLQSLGQGIYQSKPEDLPLLATTAYTIHALHPIWGEVWSEAIHIPQDFPEDVSLEASLTGELWLGNSNQLEMLLRLSWQDVPLPTNYLIRYQSVTEPVFQLQADVVSEQQIYICGLESQQPPDGIYFPNDCFTDQLIQLDLLAGFQDTFFLGGNRIPVEEVALHLSIVDDNYLAYLKNQLPLETEFGISEPLPTFSNINNGYGVLSGVNTKIIRFRKPR